MFKYTEIIMPMYLEPFDRFIDKFWVNAYLPFHVCVNLVFNWMRFEHARM